MGRGGIGWMTHCATCGSVTTQTGYQVRVDGQNLVIGGTSAVAPLWSGFEFPGVLGTKTPLVNFWAFDHFCLLSWPVLMPKPGSSAQVP